jgi:hypothetical protein
MGKVPPWVQHSDILKRVNAAVLALRIPDSWNATRLRPPFEYLLYLTCHETQLIAGPLGVYLLTLMELPPLYFLLFKEFLECNHALLDKKLQLCTYAARQLRWDKILLKLSIHLPVSWNTYNRHLGHHLYTPLTGIITRAGPFNASNMLNAEHFHTFMKRCARHSNFFLISIANHYVMSVASELFRTQITFSDRASIASSHVGESLLTVPEYFSDRVVVTPLGRSVNVELSDEVWNQIDDIWSVKHPVYCSLLRRFRRELSRRRGRHQHPSIRNWTFSGAPLTDKQQMIADTPRFIKKYNRARMNNVLFRNHASQSNILADNSCIHTVYQEQVDGVLVPTSCYGVIQNMYASKICLDEEAKIIVEADWFITQSDDQISGLPVVSVDTDRGNSFNSSARFVFLEDCWRHNVVIWKVPDEWDSSDDDDSDDDDIGDKYNVIIKSHFIE